MKFKHLIPCLEAIDHQSETFFRELAAVVQPYIGGEITNTDFTTMAGKLETLIEHHTGVSMEIEDMGPIRNMGIRTPMLSAHHPFVQPYFGNTSSEDGMKLIYKAREVLSGSVDLKRSRVTGVFSKIKPSMYIGLGELDGYITAEEVAAIILHEIGHYFSYLETLGKTITTNLVLFGLDVGLRSAKSIKEREFILKKVASELDIEDRVREVDSNGSDKAIVSLYITEAANELRSQSGSLFYDSNSWEMAADQFVARHGAGRHLATALDKGNRENSDNALNTKAQYYMFEIGKVVLGILAVIAGGFVAVYGLVHFGLVMILVGFGSVFGDSYANHQPQYDNPKDRLLRLRRQLIDRSKSGKLIKADVRALVEDVALIDRLLVNYNDFSGWFTVLTRYLFSGVRKRADAAAYQKELESLALNDLFLTSAELGTA